MQYLFTSLVLIIICSSLRVYQEQAPQVLASEVLPAPPWESAALPFTVIEYQTLFNADAQPLPSVMDALSQLLQRHDLSAELVLSAAVSEAGALEEQLFRAEQLRSALLLRGVSPDFVQVLVSSKSNPSGAEAKLLLSRIGASQ